jgi:hypothetical protein
MTGTVHLGEILAREPFACGRLVSGSTFEWAVLHDGRRVILKHLPAEGDWLTRFSGGAGRARALWDGGVLEHVGRRADHAVIGMLREDDHDVVVMRDVGTSLLPTRTRLAAPAIDDLLRGMAQIHRDWEGCAPSGLCSPGERHRVAAPAFHRDDSGPHPCPFRSVLLRGWEQFSDLAPADVTAAVFAVLADVDGLGAQLEAASPTTLLHGDFKLGNLGLRDGHLILIDWGELTGTGPAEIDVAWFAMTSTNPPVGRGEWAIDAMPDVVLRAYEAQSGRHLDPGAVDLACIGALAQCGFMLGAFAASDPESAAGVRASLLLRWWVDRVRQALDTTWSPT